MKWVYLLIAVSGEVVATAALKASQEFTVLAPAAVVVAGYGVAFYFLSLTLNQSPGRHLYALWSGIGIVLSRSSGGSFSTSAWTFRRCSASA